MFEQNSYTMPGTAREFMYKVYGWMATALAVTAAIAYYIGTTPAIYTQLFQSSFLLIGIVIAQVALVMFLGWKIMSLSYTEAVIAFMAYAMLVGVTTSSVLLVYTMASIYLAFIITAGMFGAMALYGYYTEADLSSMGSFLVMGLFGVMLAMLVNMWFKNPLADYYISLAAVGIFTLLTAYDVQKIKRIGESLMVDAETKKKLAILGALTLYLDFINLFLHLLRVMGKKRN
jgi:FtsH-binding integral membrane protein